MKVIAAIVTKVIRGYQLVFSPWLAWRCRYDPSCSEYMRLAIIEHGTLLGIWMGLQRLIRCHPWGGHGDDPVPPKHDTRCND